MRHLHSFASLLTKLAAFAAAAILTGIIGFIVVEITLRNLWSTSTYMLDEMVGYGLATMTFLGLALAFEQGAVIRVGIITDRLNPAGRARSLFEFVAIVATLALMAVAILGFVRSVSRNYARGITSGTMADVPMWIPEAIVLCGMVVFTLQLISYGLRIAAGQTPQSGAETSGPGL